MVRSFFERLSHSISDLFHSPFRIFLISSFLVVGGLVVDGSLFRLWRLHRDSSEIDRKMSVLKVDTEQIELNIKRGHDPNFMELEAREKFDLANEGELVFVFADSD